MFVDMKLLDARTKSKCADLVSHLSKMKLHLNSFLNSAAKKRKEKASLLERKLHLHILLLSMRYYVLYVYVYLLLYISLHCLLQNKEINSILCI